MKLKDCTKCKLQFTRTQVVLGKGSIKAKVMFVGEAPGKHEDEKGKPFCGMAGNVLDDRILKVLKLNRKKIWVTNSVKCRPPNNRKPNNIEVDKCIPWLRKEINIIKPKIIICLGKTAESTIRTYFKVTGRYSSDANESYDLYYIKKIKCHVYFMLHPASILYSSMAGEKLDLQVEQLKEWFAIADIKNIV